MAAHPLRRGRAVGVVSAETLDWTAIGSGYLDQVTWRADGRAYLGKVEGLAVRRTMGPEHLELLLVTDDDQGGSTALVAEVGE